MQVGTQQLCRLGQAQLTASESCLSSPEGVVAYGSWLYVGCIECSSIVQVGRRLAAAPATILLPQDGVVCHSFSRSRLLHQAFCLHVALSKNATPPAPA